MVRGEHEPRLFYFENVQVSCHGQHLAVVFSGVLACLDGYLNMALEQSEEYGVDGLLKAKYGDCFIRGNNGKS